MMCTDILAHPMTRANVLIDFHIHRFENGDEFPWPLPVITVPVDLARTSVKGREEMQRPRPLVLMLHAVGQVVGPGWQGWGWSGPRLQGGFLIEGEHHLICPEGTGIEVNQLGDGGIEGGVPRVFGVPPQMMAPRLHLRRGENPPYGRGRELLNDPLGDELPRQFVAIPLREAAAQHIRPLAGQAHDVDRDLRGKNPLWPHGQGRPRGPPHAGRETVWPTDGPRGVARRPPAPQRMGRTLPPVAG